MKTIRICGQCGTPLTAEAPEGLCPACLMKAGIGSGPAAPAGSRGPNEPPSPELLAKDFPQLEIIELLGQGGMGTVYKARQPQLDRFVALKILSAELSRQSAFAERFTREARALARLNHPNIVAVYDFGKAGDFYYFIMEYVDGMNLCQLEATKEKLDPEQALAIIPKICEALQYAHDEGIVHRDIKPGNILIDKKGRVKIADFGLAKLLGKPAELMLTQSQALLGTPLYMAPEQLSDPQKVDHRADIYSLGVVFYEMLTGDLPMGRFAPPSQKAQIDVRLDEVVLRTLEREPERRYQHAGDVKTDIDQLSTSAAAKEKARVSGAHAQRIWIAGASALLVVLSVLAGVHFWPRTQKNEQLDKGLPPSAAMDHAGHPATQTPSGGRIVRSFAAADRPISGELVATLNDGWLATCASTQTFRLFEVPTPGLENCVLTYQAQLKTEGLEGRAYLEMWCQFPGRGEFFSRGLDNTVSGSTDWTTCQTPFFSKVGEKVDRVRLNLVVEGRGKVFIKDIQLYSAPHQ